VAAFAEKLCDHCGVVRVGPMARAYGDPYEYSVTYVERGAFAEPVGFDHPKISKSDFADILRAINRATGKLVAYDRAGPPPTRLVQINPELIEGRISMSAHKSHTHVPSPEDALDAHGKIKPETLAADAAQANEMFASGKETMLDVKRLVFHDGSVMDCFHHIATEALG
jgi:hypothetical protein